MKKEKDPIFKILKVSFSFIGCGVIGLSSFLFIFLKKGDIVDWILLVLFYCVGISIIMNGWAWTSIMEKKQ